MGTVLAFPLTPRTDNESLLRDFALDIRNQNTGRSYLQTLAAVQTMLRKPLLEVTSDDLRMWARNLTGKANSIRQRCFAVRSFYKWCMRRRLLAVNPSEILTTREATSPIPDAEVTTYSRWLTEAEVGQLLDQLRSMGDRQYLAGLLMAYASLRREEVASLRWDNEFTSGEGVGLRVTGKGDKTRSVLMHPDVLAVWNAQERKGEFVFANSHGHADSHTIWTWVKEAATAAGIRLQKGKRGKTASAISPHWLRHSSATAMRRHGATRDQIQEHLGHASPNTTRIYDHLVHGLDASPVKALPSWVATKAATE